MLAELCDRSFVLSVCHSVCEHDMQQLQLLVEGKYHALRLILQYLSNLCR